MSDSPTDVPPQRQPLTFSLWLAGMIRRWRYVLWGIVLSLVAGGLATVLIPPVYKSHASFVAHSSASGRVSQALGSGALRGLTSQLGLPISGDVTESPSFYVKLVDSEEIRRRLARSRMPDMRTEDPNDSVPLIDLMRIRSRDPERRMEIAVKRLARNVTPTVDTRANIVSLEARAEWPEVAAAMASRTVALVDEFNRQLRNQQAREKREFLQQRLDSAVLQLRLVEDRQRVFYEQNRQWRNSPGLTFEEARLRRSADVATDLYLTLQRLFETARLDEFDNAGMVGVLDSGVVPRRAQWPRYGVVAVGAILIGTLLGIVFAGSGAVLSDWRTRNPAAVTALNDSLAETPLRRRRRRRPRTSEVEPAPR